MINIASYGLHFEYITSGVDGNLRNIYNDNICLMLNLIQQQYIISGDAGAGVGVGAGAAQTAKQIMMIFLYSIRLIINI